MKSPQNMWFQKQNIYLKPSKNGSFSNPLSHKISWCFQIYVLFHLYLGRWSNLTIICFRWVGEKPPTRDDFMICCIPSQDCEDSNSNTQSSDSTEDPRFDDGDLVAVGFHEVIDMFLCGGWSHPKKNCGRLSFWPFLLDRNMFAGLKPCSKMIASAVSLQKTGPLYLQIKTKMVHTVCQSMRMHV